MASKFAEDYKKFMEAHPEADAVRRQMYAAPDEYEENERQRQALANRLRNYYEDPARRREHQQTVLPSQREGDSGLSGRITNWFARQAVDDSERGRLADRIVAHNAQAAQMGIQPMYDVNSAASAYLGYMQLPEAARNPQLEEYYRMIQEGSQASLEQRVEALRQQNMQRSEQWFADHEAMYANITQNPDFAENINGWNDAAQFAQTTPEAEAYRNYMLYTPENMRNSDVERQLREASEASVAQQEADVFQMSDEQKQIYQYLLNTQGKRAAQEYKDYISYEINAQSVENVRQAADYNAEDNVGDRIGRTILSSPANVLGSGFGALDIIGQNIRNRFGEYRPIDYNRGAQEMGEWAQAVREHTMDDMGNTGDFFYGVGTSMLDSWTALGVGVLTGSPQVGTALLGLSAARQGMRDAAQAGATDSQAVAIGMFNGVAEFLMENIGIDNLYRILTDSGVKGFKNILRTVLGQSFAEASEEGLTTLANTMGDAVIMGDKSQINRTIAELVAQGVPEQEARYEAIRQWFRQLGMDILAGGLSGAGSGGIGVGANVLANRRSESQQAAQPMQTVANTATAAEPVQEQVLAEPVALAETQPVATAETAQEAPMQTVEEVVEQATKPTQAVSEAENTAQKTVPATRKIRAKDSKGESVEIVDAVMGQDENIAFKTADGRTILADELDTTGNPKTMRLAEAAQNLNEEGASGLMINYDGGDVMPYIRAYNLVYQRAQRNMSMYEAVRGVELSNGAAQAAYTAGQVERMANEGTQETRGGVIRSFTSTVSAEQERSLEVLDAMASAIGRTLVITDRIDYVEADGTVRTSGSNAQFDPKTNRYTIALDAVDKSYINVFAHETVHDIESNSPEDFAILREVVFDWLKASGRNIEQMRDVQRNLAKGYDDTYYDAEIVSNSVAAIFAERKTFRKFMDEFMNRESYSDEHRRVFMELVDSVLEFIRKALDNLSQYRSWSQVKALRQQRDMIEAVRDAYFAGLQNATRQEAQGEGETRDSAMDDLRKQQRRHRKESNEKALADSAQPKGFDLNGFHDAMDDYQWVRFYREALAADREGGYDISDVVLLIVDNNLILSEKSVYNNFVVVDLWKANESDTEEELWRDVWEFADAQHVRRYGVERIESWVKDFAKADGQRVFRKYYNDSKQNETGGSRLGRNGQAAVGSSRQKGIDAARSAESSQRNGTGRVSNLNNEQERGQTDTRFSDGEIRNSAKDTVDSQGNELSSAQQEYFADSKVRDGNGNLLVMYHGTPKAGFTEFRSGAYFTQDREYADVYQNPGASSLRVKTGETSPDTYEVYLNITKPFDTRNATERRIFEREFYGEYGGTPLMESGLPDWTDGIDLLDFIEERGYDYDGLILDEGGVGGYGDEVKSRGLSYVVLSPEQVKNIDNKTPTDSPDIRYSAKDVDVEALQAENAQLRAANAELAAQMKRTKGVNLDERAIRRFAQKLVKREGSTFDAGQLANSLSLIYDDMVNADDLTDEDAARIIQSGTHLARQVLERARYFDQDGYDADSAVREFLRDTAVEIPAEYDDAIKRMATNRTAYRAQTRGVLNIVGKGKGVSIDQLWQSGSEDFPTVFSENVTNPEDMVEQLFVIAQGLKEDAYFGDNPYADDLDTAANILFLEMQAELMNIPRVRTLADKAAEAAKANRRAERAEARYEKKKTELADVRARNAERREDANRRKYRDRVTRTANSLYQWAAKPNSKNYIPETMRLTVVKMLRALDMEGRMVEEAPKPPTHPGENATKEQMSAYRARETVYKRRLEAYRTKTQAKTTQSILWEQRMLKFADEMQKARGAENGASSFAASTDPDLPDAIRNYFKENPHVHLATMNAAQMKELSELLGRIEKAVTSENKRHAEYRNQTIAQTAADTKTAWREREEANETVLGKISTSKLAMAQMDAMNTAHMLGGGAQSIIQELRDGEDVFIEHIEEAMQVLEPEIKKLNKGRLSSTKVVQTPDGKYTHAIVLHSTDGDVTLTRAQVMSLYCLNKREQARGHLYGGGIVSTRDGKKRTYRLTEQQVQEACGHLTDTERGVADVMQNLLSTVCAEWGNEATMELYGYKKFREKFYFPISTVELGRDVAYDPNASETTIAQRGFSQNTKDNATNAIYIGDVLTVVAKHVADMAEYGAYLTRISDAMRWLNYRGYTDADGTNYVNVKAELVRAFPGKEHRSGKDADKSAMEVYITDLIRSINGGASRTGTSNAITRLSKGAAVGANVSVAIQQPASYARAGVLLSARDLAFAKVGLLSKKERDLMYKYAPITRWKSYGFFQAGTGRNVEALLRGDDNFYQTLREKQGLLAEAADNNTWLRLWNACKHEQKRLHKDMDHKSDEFYRLVGKRLSEVIDRTQVVDSPFHRAPIVNDPRYVTLTAFQSEVFKSFGVAQSCTYDVVLEPKSKKAWKALGKGISAHVTAQILAGWLSAAWSAFIRDKDEEKGDELVERWLIKWGWIKPTGKYTRWEKFLVQGVQRSLGNLNPMRLHWIGNKVSDVIENGFAGAFFGNDSVDDSFFNAISKFIAESIKLVAKRREGEPTDPTNLIGYGLQAGSYGSGLGVATAIRDAKGIYRLIKDILKPEAYAPTMDDVFYYAETGVNEDDMSQVLATETAKVQEDYPSYSTDKAERTARGNLRSEITSEYKEAYAQAFAEGDKETMREIRQFMADTGLYIDGTEPADACERWLRDYFKNQYLEASTDEERKEARRLLGRSGYYDSPRELNEAIEGWTE